MRGPEQDPDASYRRLLQGNESIIIRVHVKSVWDLCEELEQICSLKDGLHSQKTDKYAQQRSQL